MRCEVCLNSGRNAPTMAAVSTAKRLLREDGEERPAVRSLQRRGRASNRTVAARLGGDGPAKPEAAVAGSYRTAHGRVMQTPRTAWKPAEYLKPSAGVRFECPNTRCGHAPSLRWRDLCAMVAEAEERQRASIYV